MQGLAGIAVFFAVGLVVSARLLALWRRTGRLPELLAALGLLGIGPLGFCLFFGGLLVFHGSPLGKIVSDGGLLIQALGFVASAVFTWRVFRPGSAWARALALGLCTGVLATAAAWVLVPGHSGVMRLQHHADLWLKILCLGWGAFESLRYWHVTRRRAALGLADPVVSASFLWWGVALLAGGFGFVLAYDALLALAPGARLGARVQLEMSLCGIVTAGALYLAFLPPRRYARWIDERASAPAKAA
jgi:hypothetical protein